MRRIMRVAGFVCATAGVVLAACGSDESPSDEQQGDGDADGKADAGEPADDDKDDGGLPPDGEDAGEELSPDGGDGEGGDGDGECLAKNGELMANGLAELSLTNTDANLGMPAPSTIDCQGQYEPGGVGGGTLNVSCFGIADPYFYGFTFHVFTTPEIGKSYPIGSAASVSDGMGGYKSNEEVTFEYEEGPHCESKQGMVKLWAAQPAADALMTVDSLADGVLTLTLSPTSFGVAPGFNEQGTGGFQLSFTASMTLPGL
jgi:hypothetical protein